MSATQSSDFVFAPKVWKDHIRAYFDKKLVFGAMAVMDYSLASQPGETVNFPYFKAISAAEEPAEDAGLTVDKLQDDSFSATVKEVGKAVGIKKKAFKKSAATQEAIISEIQAQLGRVHAEKVDSDLLTEINTSGNYVAGFTATAAADVMNIRNLLQGKVVGFGDKHDQAVAVQMHSLQFMDMMKDTTTGFLNADAMDPLWGANGFQGRTPFGMAVFVSDQCPAGATTDGKATRHAFVHKMSPYGICMKQDLELESDKDILAREWVFTSNEWYAVKSFHAKINSLDYKTARLFTTVSA